MYTYTKRSRRFVSNGNELIKYCAVYPCLESAPQISSFYEKLAQNCESWCEKVKLAELSQDPQNRVKPLTYSFDATVTYISESILCVRTEVSLRQSKRLILTQNSDAQVWQLHSELILPPKRAYPILREASGLPYPKNAINTDPIILIDGEIYTLCKNDWVKLEIKPQKAQKIQQSP